jgi:hypothetical protein
MEYQEAVDHKPEIPGIYPGSAVNINQQVNFGNYLE